MIPGKAYLSVEVFDPRDTTIRTRGYIEKNTDPRLLALAARDALKALENRNLASGIILTCISELDIQLDLWGLPDIHPNSGSWRGETRRDWQ